MMDRPIRVLIVEDNPYDARLIHELIGETAVPTEIESIKDGDSAIHALERAEMGSKIPDLVLLDLNLPGRNGHEVLEFIRKREGISSTCVFIYTGSRSPEDERRARQNNADGYLVKPMGKGEIEEMIKALKKVLHLIAGDNTANRRCGNGC